MPAYSSSTPSSEQYFWANPGTKNVEPLPTDQINKWGREGMDMGSLQLMSSRAPGVWKPASDHGFVGQPKPGSAPAPMPPAPGSIQVAGVDVSQPPPGAITVAGKPYTPPATPAGMPPGVMTSPGSVQRVNGVPYRLDAGVDTGNPLAVMASVGQMPPPSQRSAYPVPAGMPPISAGAVSPDVSPVGMPPAYVSASRRGQRAPDGPQPDGTYMLNGVKVSAADHAAAQATSARNASLAADAGAHAIGAVPAGMPPGYDTPPAMPPITGMPPGYVQSGGIDVKNYAGSRYDPDFARNNPQLFQAPDTPETITQRQQLGDANGKIPGRHYDPANIAAASPAWLASETAMLPGRLDTAALTQTLPPVSGAPTAMPDVSGMPPVDRGQEYLRAGGRDLKMAEYLTKSSAPPKQGGFATADEAQKSIPAGAKGQVQQNAEGRWIVQYGVNEPGPKAETTEAERLFSTLSTSGLFDKKPENLTATEKQQLARWSKLNEKPKSLAEQLADLQAAATLAKGGTPDGAGASQGAAPAAPAAPAVDPTKPMSAADAAKLPKGTRFLGVDGKIRIKS